MKRIRFDMNGVSKTVWAESINGTLWFQLDGEVLTYTPEVPKSRRRGAGSSSASGKSGDILAPMPGKITRILKKESDVVAAAEVVVVMEAMKMEYTLKSSVAGQVAKIRVREGDQVVLGQTLVVMQAGSPKKVE